MTAVTFPRRVTSTPTTITVNASSLAWLPSAGYFKSVSLANATSVDPDPSNTSVYRGVNAGGFGSIWTAYSGGAYAPTLGTYGSMLFMSGGNRAYDGNEVVAYDIAARTWNLVTQPTLTGTIGSSDSDSVNDRVGLAGQWIKYSDGSAIPNTNVDGSTTTNWLPYPIHSLCGLTFIPSDAGGGTLGSLIMVGHDMNVLCIQSSYGKVWSLDLSTKVWSVVPFAFSQAYIPHGAEYDSFNKLLWVVRGDSSPLWAHSYLTGVSRSLSSPNINNTSNYGNLCFMPNRKLLVRATGTASTLSLAAIDVSTYVHGTSTSVTAFNLSTTGTFPTTLRNTYGANDKLEYCDYDGCLYYLERKIGGTTCTLFKLTPPAVGQESSQPWQWTSETIQITAGDTYGAFACSSTNREPAWGGKARYIPALKSMLISDLSTYPVQAIRSSAWT